MIYSGKLFTHLILFLFILSMVSCTSDDDCCLPPPPPAGAKVWILNEGGFLQNNSSLDVFDSETSIYSSSVFEGANGRGIGDIFQSITFYGNKAYLLVNNSSRIEVINSEDFSIIRTIEDHVYSPRYGVVVGDKIYVSDISRPYLYIIDPEIDAIVDSIFTRVSMEDMEVYDNLIYGSANNFVNPLNQVYVIDPNNAMVIDSVQVGLNPNALTSDAEGMLWVMCDGQYGSAGTEGLFRIDPETNTVDKSFDFTTFSPQYPNVLEANQSNGRHIYMSGSLGVYKMDIGASTMPEIPFIQFIGTTYSIGVNPQNDDVYVGDAADFSAKGSVKLFDSSGNAISSFPAGHLPGRFYFR